MKESDLTDYLQLYADLARVDKSNTDHINKSMLQNVFLFAGLTAISFFAFLNWNCTKLDTTKIGSDLIGCRQCAYIQYHPRRDLDPGLFLDSTYIFSTFDYALGSINNDPLFGLTTANVFLQLKPPFFPYYIGDVKDTLHRSQRRSRFHRTLF